MSGSEKATLWNRSSSNSSTPADATSVDRFLEANTVFHLMVASASASRRLTQTLEIILVQMERLFRIGLLLSSRADEIVHEHQDLLQAILAGDSERARRVAVDQVRASQRMVVDALVSSDDVTRLPINLPPLKAAADG